MGGVQGGSALKRLLNESVLNRLVQSCQIKFLNYFMVAVVQELVSSYATENDHYLNLFVTFCSPQSLQKLATSIRIGHVRLFENGLSSMFTQKRQQAGAGSSTLPSLVAMSSGLPDLAAQNSQHANASTTFPMSYLSQQALWTLLTASLEQADSPLLRSASAGRLGDTSSSSCPIEALCNMIAD